MAEALTAEHILTTTEDVLRRYGPAKATVVDVARALGVSHGSVYRHFPTKAALREAVTERWLEQAHAGLKEIAESDAPAPEKLRSWLQALFDAKRKKALGDPELFATFEVLAKENSDVVAEHVREMVEQVAAIVGDQRTAQAVFNATERFHNPVHAADWVEDDVQDKFDAVCDLVIAGLEAS
ncbi:TetR family transcriptional regulator [Lentzea sp. NBRC 105346]|uniref:TetR/AcrR family transcriptional regulator n=1 Tax=Lentzea sp. NBRC 105346 TaxID=3032205 RepID=UPI0024A518BF|nr:TetR/AcrR family transcriptional regulator [Lentzea sp. NBRC 105346]GLZ29845.1 TetR family transcriptional regulator [Lentzea sp. NBRC 105346]